MIVSSWPGAVLHIVSALAVVTAVGLAARWGSPELSKPLERALESRFAPVVLGALTALLSVWMWGSLSAPAVIHDESAYLLQARIFASGHLSAPPPALPEFFEQYHVLLTPRLAPKYLPGHALMLVPGIWLGLPGLMPVLLGGVAAGLLFALSRRVAGCWVAALSWMISLTSPADVVWRCMYLSESTSSAVWLGAAWFLLRWWEGGRSRDLVFVALLCAWLAITRPLTAIAVAFPVGVVVLVGVWRRQAFAALGSALAAGLVVLCLVPVWNAASLRDWRTTPYAEYSRVYFPYQKLGFGVDPAPPLRALPADMVVYDAKYRRIHAAHTVRDLPRAAVRRVYASCGAFLGEGVWRAPLGLFLLLGLLRLRGPAIFGLVSSLSLFVAYLAYAHPLDWLIYYAEGHAFLAFAVALGLWQVLVRLSSESHAPLAAAALLALAPALGALDVVGVRRGIQHSLSYHRGFAEALAKLPHEKAVVFVRYAPNHDVNDALVENPPDYDRARVWVAYDRGRENARLLVLDPERVPYLFDEAASTLYPLPPPPP